MLCPICQSPTQVQDSRDTAKGAGRRRVRKCTSCGETFSSREFLLPRSRRSDPQELSVFFDKVVRLSEGDRHRLMIVLDRMLGNTDGTDVRVLAAKCLALGDKNAKAAHLMVDGLLEL